MVCYHFTDSNVEVGDVHGLAAGEIGEHVQNNVLKKPNVSPCFVVN